MKRHYNAIYRVGEEHLQHCGMTAKIIAYRASYDIDVRFQDETVVTGRSYGAFLKGAIHNPNLRRGNTLDRTGETKKMNCGMMATIIEYFNTSHITVQFEDGVVVKDRTYTSFSNGTIAHDAEEARSRRVSAIRNTYGKTTGDVTSDIEKTFGNVASILNGKTKPSDEKLLEMHRLYSTKQLAVFFGKSPNTVKTWLRKSRARLRKNNSLD